MNAKKADRLLLDLRTQRSDINVHLVKLKLVLADRKIADLADADCQEAVGLRAQLAEVAGAIERLEGCRDLLDSQIQKLEADRDRVMTKREDREPMWYTVLLCILGILTAVSWMILAAQW